MTDYYVDSVNGSDANTGFTPAQAKATFAQINSLTGIQAGGSINLARGSFWRDIFSVAGVVGGTGYPFVIRSYGSGDMPEINGADIVTTPWVKDSIGWFISIPSVQGFHHSGNVRLIGVATSAELLADTQWFDTVNLKQYVRLAGDVDPNTLVMEMTSRLNCISMINAHDIEIYGIHCRYSRTDTIFFSSALHDIHVHDNKCWYAGNWNDPGSGIGIFGTSPLVLATRVFIMNNDCRYNQNNGIEVSAHDGLIMQGNYLYKSGSIELWGSINNSHIVGNQVWHSSAVGYQVPQLGRGLWIAPASKYGASANITIAGNLFVGATKKILSLQSGVGHIIQNNILYHSDASISWLNTIELTDGCSALFRNNIICVTHPQPIFLTVLTGSTATLDYNIYWAYNTTSDFAKISQVDKDLGVPSYSLATLQGLGDELHGMNADPLFTNPAAGDFSLQANSPVFAKGTKFWGSGVRPQALNGALFDTQNPDMGCYQKRGQLYPGQ